MTHDAEVLSEQLFEGVVRITLNRPGAFNALSEHMLAVLSTQIDALAQMPTPPKVVILAAVGAAFCAGHDLKQMREEPSLSYYRTLFAQCSRMMMSLQKLPSIVIAQVQGLATAAGCQLVAMCDLAIASDSSRFAVSGVNLGLFCSTPSVALSRTIAPKHAMYLLVTGEFISAATACDWGLINEAVPDDALVTTVLSLAQKIATKPAPALHLGKRLFYEQRETRMAQAYELAGETMAKNMMESSALEGVQAFIEKRPPHWKSTS